MTTSSCPGCGVSYGRVPIHTLVGSDLVAYCELCHRELTLGAKKSHITTAINQRKESGQACDTLWQIALDEADWEHFIHWRGKVV